MYTQFSKQFTEADQKFLKAFINQYREKFVKMYFAKTKVFSNSDGDYYLGYRTNDDEQVFQALCQNVEKLKVDVNKFMIDIDNRENREHHLKEAFKNASSCDYYYAFEKDWGGGLDLAQDAYVPEEESVSDE